MTEIRNSVFKSTIEHHFICYLNYSIRTFKYCGKYFFENIGKMYIDEIRYTHLQSFFESRKDKGIGQNKNIRKTLSATFKHARRNEYINNDPLKDVKVKGIDNHKEKRVITINEYNRIIEALQSYNDFTHYAYALAFEIGYLQGLRLSEICALEKNDIDFENLTINVDKKMNYKGLRKENITVTHDMKSKNSKMVLPLPVDLAHSLKLWFQINPYEKVICDDNGDYIHPESMTNSIRNICDKLGIKICFHETRHSFVSNGLANGIDPVIMMKLARHGSLDTTLGIYTHIEESRKRDAINKICNAKSVVNVSQNGKK